MKPGWIKRSEVVKDLADLMEYERLHFNEGWNCLAESVLKRILELGMTPPLRENLVWTGDFMDDGKTKCYYQKGCTREWVPEDWNAEGRE